MPPRRSLQPAFGAAVRRRRLAAELSQEALAAAAGLTAVYVSRIENGRATPSINAAAALARGLACAAWELVKEAEGPAPEPVSPCGAP